MPGYVLRASCIVVMAVLAVALAYGWLIAWASQKPHQPTACSGMSPYECTALAQEVM